MSLKSDLDSLADRLSLPKRFPGYFTVPLFRFSIFVMLFLMFVVAWQTGFDLSPHLYIECPVDVFKGRCANQFYGPTCVLNVPSRDVVLCSKEFFFAGETYGVKPGFLQSNFTLVGLFVVVLTFVVNHLFYRWRSGKWFYSR